MYHSVRRLALPLIAAFTLGIGMAHADTTLLNVSYDVTRELYKDYNAAFIRHWQQQTGESLTVRQSHGGSSKQALSVTSGLDADVVTMNQATDIDLLATRGLVPANWQQRLPNNSAPYTTIQVFLVRKGNPKGIKDWSDLTRPGVQVVVPNPKVSGNGRYTYLAAWGYAIKKGGGDKSARDFVTALFRNVPVLDGGGRAATTTFTQRNIGDVLVTFENEVQLIKEELGNSGFEVVYPSSTILAEPPVAIVDKVVDKRGTRKQAQAYLDYLYSEEGQTIVAQHYFRPRNAKVAQKFARQFPRIKTFTVNEVFGSWAQAQKLHFADGGLYDQIYKAGR